MGWLKSRSCSHNWTCPDRPFLAHGGRMALTVWNSTGCYNSAVSQALAKFVGDDVAVRFCASRQAPGKEELKCLATDAGFSAVEVQVKTLIVHLPRPEKFVPDRLHLNPAGYAVWREAVYPILSGWRLPAK